VPRVIFHAHKLVVNHLSFFATFAQRAFAAAVIFLFVGVTRQTFRHSKFVGLRDDKDPRSVVKKYSGK
jgi:hypothetical protein